ncbi:TPA: bifunctional DNA-formamidopyrimidine glycosylase/DNA-(apurinic or apyrimidinic site) lyase [Mannheimia haemolytica]|uniref:Formamidopyrimidine-DNA glycosylase n=1 Tax=Mannheimia haemolytica TaxID=75985 RepID=A0A248ZWW3_MANHA|nr:bifunctional DNA-formamidopyrimidine glycosylase/DNA-(apurinic or apyrimidinic site) lyase [Mannheimia haemolytica]AWW70566.1 bifunctional DNA-formamidopyrimidine glycosylase/DNA-(apurinic or apyrimidinic site) lyase [Pasteurellaceae bacterium 12565]AGI31626.1 bifunctional DNA-formamidopyrimidine glycosylase/DNA-(apurinic or apyrimidinic site) lyase [Mannheimia haemolytica USDA-ARS-USMARC-183]AGI36266.1 bifunctional DNA-formamidopyrimidine glycosylase/DNA-(apurinic or apyrimidinic site) lyase
MPELPEVETSVRGVSPYLVGQTIEQIIVRQPKLRWTVSPELSQMAGAKITAVERRAKYLIIRTDKGDILVHLGMSGSLGILQERQQKEIGKHDHVDLITQNGTILRYNDPRKFGCWLWAEKAEDHELLRKLGPEPLSNDFTADYLFAKSRKKTTACKTFIMTNEVVVGVGNIYACESLFMAGIHPELAAQNLTKKQCERLVKTIKEVLTKAIIQGGTTLKDFIQPDGKPGYFAQVLQVYGRKGETCNDCGKPIETKVIGQRNTYFCPKCQRLPK